MQEPIGVFRYPGRFAKWWVQVRYPSGRLGAMSVDEYRKCFIQPTFEGLPFAGDIAAEETSLGKETPSPEASFSVVLGAGRTITAKRGCR